LSFASNIHPRKLGSRHGLVVHRGREDLALASGNGNATLDRKGHGTGGGLNTESQRVKSMRTMLLAASSALKIPP
jgi:hypothetical protein